MFVISVSSRRGRGHVVACDLLRVVCRCVARVARDRKRAAALVGWRGRVASSFDGYLTTEKAPKVWRDRRSGRVVVLSDRWSGSDWVDLRDGFEDAKTGAFIDATAWLGAGSCEPCVGGGEVCASVVYVARAGLYS